MGCRVDLCRARPARREDRPIDLLRRERSRPVTTDRVGRAVEADHLTTWQTHRKVLGARQLWLRLRRDRHDIARCTVERLMRELGIAGVVRGKRKRPIDTDLRETRPADLVDRHFARIAPHARRRSADRVGREGASRTSLSRTRSNPLGDDHLEPQSTSIAKRPHPATRLPDEGHCMPSSSRWCGP